MSENGMRRKSFNPSSAMNAPKDVEQNLIEEENEARLSELAGRVSSIKQIAGEINIQVDESNKMLDGMDTDMTGMQGILGGARERLRNLSISAGSCHMCYLVLFFMAVFILLYFLIKWVRR